MRQVFIEVAPSTEDHVFIAQATHSEDNVAADLGDHVPALHCMHWSSTEAPIMGWYDPGGHEAQIDDIDAPRTDDHVPTLHKLQKPALDHEPTLHITHEALPRFEIDPAGQD